MRRSRILPTAGGAAGIIAEAPRKILGYNRAGMGLPRLQQQVSSPEDEAQWILRCQAGDSAAFRSLVERYERRAFWIAYHMLGHVEDAQDVVQEAFIRVFRALPRFRLGKRFYTWFYRIVLHLAIDTLRKRREAGGRVVEVAETLEEDAPDPSETFLRDESAARVQEVLEKLPPKERAILVLRDIEGFSAKEIADIIQSNHATVRWWLFLARKEFRRAWEGRYGKEDPCA
jgi:RNA polymerase sigma-70 factor, ECF subfamily